MRPNRRRCALSSLLLALSVVGCGGTSIENPGLDLPDLGTDAREAVDAPPTDLALPDFQWGDADVPGKPDGDAGDDTPGGHLGDPCVDNADCAGHYCVEGFEGSICTEVCLDDCPEGYSCRVVLNFYPDVVSLCVPDVLRLCSRCQSDDQCFGGVCVPSAEGSFCAAQCPEGVDCPATFVCQPFTHPATGLDLRVCQPSNGSCVCRPSTAGQLRSCEIANAFGTCWGFEACQGDAGWEGCNAATPAEEACNGQDDDCDGLVDEDLLPQPCQNQVPDVGTCTGEQRCAGEAGWICDARAPAPETCNYQDDDCDGETDEGFATLDPATEQILYLGYENCGACGVDCTGAIANAASTRCQVAGGFPVCAVEACDDQYYKLNDFQCILPPGTFCSECETDADCFGNSCQVLGADATASANARPTPTAWASPASRAPRTPSFKARGACPPMARATAARPRRRSRRPAPGPTPTARATAFRPASPPRAGRPATRASLLPRRATARTTTATACSTTACPAPRAPSRPRAWGCVPACRCASEPRAGSARGRGPSPRPATTATTTATG